MLQPISQASWPAGIPEIHLHPTDSSREELAEEAKGWLLFVREESQPTSTPEDALHQRRALVKKWATASQEFRECYHTRAPAYASALDYPASVLSQLVPRPEKRFLCLPPVDRQAHPRNYIHLVKLLILLYVHQDEWTGSHPVDLGGAGNAPRCHIPELLAAPTTLSGILPSLYLDSADFSALSMTRYATGRLTLVEFGCNGRVRVSTLRRPWNMGQTMAFEQILGRFLSEIADSGIGGPPQYNEPLDMDLPIIELLEITRRTNKFLCKGYGHPDLWACIIEQSAPGYLELEAQGREVEFELDNLLEIDR